MTYDARTHPTMTIARKRLFDETVPTWLHCTSRCVRRAYLAGDKFDHRKAWIEERLQLLSRCFAVEVAGYAVMSNHVHVIIRMVPSQPETWSADAVVRRWRSAFPKKTNKDGSAQLPSEADIAVEAMDTLTVEKWRKRLSNVGYFMKAFKEPISRRANKEDGCSGAFWEGRYHSQVLLDQAALIACMAYIDLNPIRAKITDRPETSTFTSGYRRIRARNRHRAAEKIKARRPQEAEKLLTKVGLHTNARHAEDGLWLTPLNNCIVGEVLANKRFSPDDYVHLLDVTGRLLKQGKRGKIPDELAPILQRLDLSVDAWLATMLGWRMFALGAAVGQHKERMTEAARRGLQWLRNRCPLFPAPPTTERHADSA
jgi:REP element-mobilizing transposase RayT